MAAGAGGGAVYSLEGIQDANRNFRRSAIIIVRRLVAAELSGSDDDP